MTGLGSHANAIGPDHHEEMEAHYADGLERQDEDHLREITRWLTDQMCRVEEPLIGQVSNPLSVSGARRLNELMQAKVHYGGAGLKGIRGSQVDIDLVRHWQAEAARASVLVERCRSWQAVAERLETEAQELLSVCECEIRDQTNNRQASDKRSAAYAEGALRVAKGIARRIKEKAHAR